MSGTVNQTNNWLVAIGIQDARSIINTEREPTYIHAHKSDGCGVDEIDEQDIQDMYRDGCNENQIAYEHDLSITHVRYILFKHGLIESIPKKRSVGRTKRPVIQMAKDGSFIALHESIKKASIVTGVTLTNIAFVCGGKRGHAGGFKWSYADA